MTKIDQLHSDHNQSEVQQDTEELLSYTKGELAWVHKDILSQMTWDGLLALIDQEMKTIDTQGKEQWKSYWAMQTGTSDLLGQMVLDYLGVSFGDIDADEWVRTIVWYEQLQLRYNHEFDKNIQIDGKKWKDFWTAAQALINQTLWNVPYIPIENNVEVAIVPTHLNTAISRETYNIAGWVDRNKFCHGIHTKESWAANYQAKNSVTNALWRYQFVPSYHREDIQSVTWVKTYKEFLDTPAAQEKYMDYHIKENLVGEMNTLKSWYPQRTSSYTDAQLMALCHFLWRWWKIAVYDEDGKKTWWKKDENGNTIRVWAAWYLYNGSITDEEQAHNDTPVWYLETFQEWMSEYAVNDIA